MPSFVNTIAKGAVALLGVAGVASAAPSALSNTTMILEGRNYTPACRNACLAADAQYMLVTECTVDGGTTDTSYQWAEFDLNNILGYSSPDLVYQSLGLFSIGGQPCNYCTLADGSVISCTCTQGGGSSRVSLDLNTYVDDVTGVLCFANNQFGPVCGTPSDRRC